MSNPKFKVGDKVRRISGAWGNSSTGSEHVVRAAAVDGLKFEGDTVYTYSAEEYTLVQADPTEQPVLTPQEVVTAILEGVPLEYRVTVRGVACRWYTLTNPERINLADVKYSEFRKQVQTVTLSGTVPKPVPHDAIAATDKVYTVHLNTNDVAALYGIYAQAGGLYWRTQEEAEQFRDTLTQCFSTVPVLD